MYVFGCVCVVYVSVSVCLCFLEVYTKVKTLTSRHADYGNLGTSPPTTYHAYDSVFRGIVCMYVCHVSFFFVWIRVCIMYGLCMIAGRMLACFKCVRMYDTMWYVFVCVCVCVCVCLSYVREFRKFMIGYILQKLMHRYIDSLNTETSGSPVDLQPPHCDWLPTLLMSRQSILTARQTSDLRVTPVIPIAVCLFNASRTVFMYFSKTKPQKITCLCVCVSHILSVAHTNRSVVFFWRIPISTLWYMPSFQWIKRNTNTSNVSLIYFFLLHSFVYTANVHKELLLSHL